MGLKLLTANYEKISTILDIIEINTEEDLIDDESEYRNEIYIMFVSIKIKINEILSLKDKTQIHLKTE